MPKFFKIIKGEQVQGVLHYRNICHFHDDIIHSDLSYFQDWNTKYDNINVAAIPEKMATM